MLRQFDSKGRLDDLKIDFEAVAEHLYQLHVASKAGGFDIWRVIFDPELQPFLQDSPRWPYLSENLQFSTKRSWVRHDEHFHVDFDVTCKPLWSKLMNVCFWPVADARVINAGAG